MNEKLVALRNRYEVRLNELKELLSHVSDPRSDGSAGYDGKPISQEYVKSWSTEACTLQTVINDLDSVIIAEANAQRYESLRAEFGAE